jgi:hypothetical protein
MTAGFFRQNPGGAFGAWPAFFIFKSKWKFELQFAVLLKLRQRDRQQ